MGSRRCWQGEVESGTLLVRSRLRFNLRLERRAFYNPHIRSTRNELPASFIWVIGEFCHRLEELGVEQYPGSNQSVDDNFYAIEIIFEEF